jgi:hypothetical protein
MVGGCPLGSMKDVNRLIARVLEHFRGFLYATEGPVFYHAWTTYLKVLEFLPQEKAAPLWMRHASLRLFDEGQSIPFLPITEMAFVLLRMPCSEFEAK